MFPAVKLAESKGEKPNAVEMSLLFNAKDVVNEERPSLCRVSTL